MARKGAVRVSITADTSDLKRGLATSERSLASFSRSGTRHFTAFGKGAAGASSSVSKLAKAASAAGAGYLAISAAKSAVDTTVDLGKATITLNKNLGISVERSSEWAAVAKVRGIQSKALAQSFGILAKNEQAAVKGTESAVDAFKTLGISQEEVRKQSFNQTLGEIADGLSKLPPGAERTATAMKLFGRGWQTVVPLLRDGSRAMNEQLALARKYGATFSGGTIKSVHDLIKAQREAKFATLGLQVAFGTQLAPALTKVLPAVANFINQIRTGKGAGGDFARTVKDIAQAFVSVSKWVLNAIHNITRFGHGIRSIIFGAIRIMKDFARSVFSVIEKIGDLGSHLPFVGGRFRRMADSAHTAKAALDDTGGAAKRTKGYLDSLTGRRWPVNVDLKVAVKGGVGPFKPFQPSPDSFGGPDPWRVKDNVNGAVGGWVDQNRKKLEGAFGPQLGVGPLMGRSGAVDRFNPIAARFGLQITSGFRPGDPGYHGQNRARDYADGAPAMLAFAKRMAGTFGNKLTELIHTPLGFGIKNGGVVPLSFWGAKTNAMHYNHVHVALQRGGMIPGQGVGDKVPVMAEPGEGFINSRAVRALGGAPAIEAINRAVPRFQRGGTVSQAGGRGHEFFRLISMASKRSGIPPYVLAGLIDVESKWDPSAVSPAGAFGATQFMPGTAPSYGVRRGTSHSALASQVMGAAKYLLALGWKGNPKRALAAYNGGPGNPQYGYASDVLHAAETYRGLWSGASSRARPPKKNKKPKITPAQQRALDRRSRRRSRARTGAEGLDPWFTAFQSQADYELAQAELTSRPGDDITALSRAIGGYQGFLDVAKRRHDQATATSAAQALKSARDARDELLKGPDKEGGGNPVADAMADLAAQTKELADINKERAAFEKSIAYTSKEVAIKALSDVISGQIGGFTNQRRATAGDGATVARY